MHPSVHRALKITTKAHLARIARVNWPTVHRWANGGAIRSRAAIAAIDAWLAFNEQALGDLPNTAATEDTQ